MVLSHPFHSPTRVIEGHSFSSAIGQILEGRNWALITSQGWLERGIIDQLTHDTPDPKAILADVLPNPKVSSIIELAKQLPDTELVVALGGGSVLDAAKGAVATRALNGDTAALMAHLRDNVPLPESMMPTPIIAVPTTSGTGSEITRWGTLWGNDQVKHSINDIKLYPAFAVLDPVLCISMSTELTLSTALDSLSHAMESVWNKRHTAVTDELSGHAISLIWHNLASTLARPSDLELRRRIQTAALIAGLSMGTTQTALAHSISYPFTAKLGLPHGFACAFTLAEVARYNMAEAPERLTTISSALGCQLEKLPETLESWMSELGVGDVLYKYASASFIEGLSTKLMTRARAANNIREVNGVAAKKLALDAYRQLRPAEDYDAAAKAL